MPLNFIRTRLQSVFQKRPSASGARWRKRALILSGLVVALFILGHLGVRFVLWPQIEKSKVSLERLVSARLGANITMDDVQVSWTGIRPSFEILGLRINASDKSPAPLLIEKISGQLSWLSFYHLAPYFHEITFDHVQMYAQRDTKGVISVAGIPIQSKADDYSSGNWLLDQNEIQINQAQIFWEDQKNKKLKTSINIQNLRFENGIRHHQGQLIAITPWSKEAVQINADFVHRLSGQAGNWQDWIGNLSWDLTKFNLTQLAKDFTLPLNMLEGNASSKGKLNLDSGKVDGGQLYLAVDQLILQPNKNEEPIQFGRLETDLVQQIDDGLFSVSTQTLAWRNINSPLTAPLENLSPMTFRWRQPEADGEIKEFGFSSPKILIEDISKLALNLPLPKKVRQWIKLSQADGELSNLEIKWSERKSALATLPIPGNWLDSNKLEFTISASLKEVSFIGINPSIPTVSHLSGNLSSNQKQGSFTLDSRDLEIELADFLSDPKITLERANGALAWTKQKGGWLINAKKLALINPEITTSLNLSYFLAGPKQPDLMTLDMDFAKAKLESAHRYLPIGMSAESRQYLSKAFESGLIENGSLHIKGDPNQAPYPKGQVGELSLHLPITGATFKPAPLLPTTQGVWRPLNNVTGSIDMEQSHLKVSINQANYKKAALANVSAEITNLSAKQLNLLIHGEVNGPAPEILEYLFNSPVGKKQPSLEKNLSVSGLVNLNLGLKIPLSGKDNVGVDAKLTLPGNQAQWGNVPPLENLKGKIRITETNPEFEDITGNFLGGSLKIASAATTPNNSTFNISGDISANFIKDYFANHPPSNLSPLLNVMTGSAKYDGVINFNKLGSQTKLQFDLRNWANAAPKPLNKLAGAPMLGEVSLQTYNESKSNLVRADWSGKFGEQFYLMGSLGTENEFRHALGVGVNVALPQQGLAINYVGNELDLDVWNAFIESSKLRRKSAHTVPSPATEEMISVSAQIKKAVLFDRAWNDLNLTGNNHKNIWQLRLTSPQIAGQIYWHPQSASSPSGLISGRLARLKIPDEITESSSQITELETKNSKPISKRAPVKTPINPNAIPSLDLSIDDLSWSKAQLGIVKIKSLTTTDLFKLESLQILNPQGNSSITGQWQGSTPNTREQSNIEVDMQIKDAGAIIARWSNPKSVEGGQGKLIAKLNWQGPIFLPSYETLADTVNIDLTKGRLLEVNTSGAKLLDVLSLQSLLRFATLDLQGSLGNLATKGTPFNSITSNFEISQGIAQTQQFNMVLDQARVAMIGQINIPQETQDLRITIFPTIDATAGSLAAFAINPIIGLGALLGQYLITNQINRTMQTDYLVQGSWTNPEVVPLDQKGQPLDAKTLETIRTKGLLKEQSKPDTPSTQPSVTPTQNPD